MANDFWIESFQSQEPLINIQRNWRCKIENVSVTFSPTVNVLLGACQYGQIDSYSGMRLPRMQTINNSLERAIQLNEKLEQFIALTKLSPSYTPVVRSLGMYSGLGSCWEESDTSDLATLELGERYLMAELIRIGCDVRILINLDIWKALAHGFTVNDIKKRIADMCSICDDLKDYKNLSIAIDDFPSVEPVLSLDDVLMIKR